VVIQLHLQQVLLQQEYTIQDLIKHWMLT
jgi:hypothetical protein